MEGAIDLAGDDGWFGNLQLVAFAAHGLDHNRQLEFTPAGNLKSIGLIRIGYSEAHVLPLLVLQPLAQLARGNEFTFTPGPGGVVGAEDHGNGGLVDAQRG